MLTTVGQAFIIWNIIGDTFISASTGTAKFGTKASFFMRVHPTNLFDRNGVSSTRNFLYALITCMTYGFSMGVHRYFLASLMLTIEITRRTSTHDGMQATTSVRYNYSSFYRGVTTWEIMDYHVEFTVLNLAYSTLYSIVRPWPYDSTVRPPANTVCYICRSQDTIVMCTIYYRVDTFYVMNVLEVVEGID